MGVGYLTGQGGGGLKINGQYEESVSFAETINKNDPIYLEGVYNFDESQLLEFDSPGIGTPGYGKGVAFTRDGKYMAIGGNNSSRIAIYKRYGNKFEKLANPDVLPTGTVNSMEFSYDGTYLILGLASSPYLYVYKRDGDTFIKLANPASLPTYAYCVAINRSGNLIAVVGTDKKIYQFADDVLTYLTDLSATGTGRSCEFNPAGDLFCIGHYDSPCLTVFTVSGTTFTKITLTSTPSGQVNGIAFDDSGLYCAVAYSASPFWAVYKVNGETFTPLTIPAALTDDGISVSISADGNYVALASSYSYEYGITIFKNTDDVLSELIDLTGRTTNVAAKAVRFGADDTFLAVIQNDNTYPVDIFKGTVLSGYNAKKVIDTYSSDQLKVSVGIGYAKENGVFEDVKKVMRLI